MNFSQLLNSIDELLYEVMSWLVFYPITLWRVLTRPLTTMEYADDELGEREEEQYTDTLSPPLFLLISLLISHGIALALVGDSGLIDQKTGLAMLVTDDTALLIMRLLLFSLFPLIFATRLLGRRKRPLTRKSLKLPFYSQCYAAAPFALAVGLAATLHTYHHDSTAPAAAIIATVAILWFVIVQSRWYASMLRSGFGRGFLQALISFGLSAFLFVAVGLLIIGLPALGSH
ncbi:hypothetical protein ACFOMD_11685 [Sphingoaurantiacus capsulatus]|uniref:Permease n=1 Tax=Sphingoaurantiacus capsulatus TaxID=1771310 RepID=A0ABV7XAV7_9SPHN